MNKRYKKRVDILIGENDKQISFNVRKNISVPVNMEVLTKVPIPDWMRKE
jgi:hypothetical protein